MGRWFQGHPTLQTADQIEPALAGGNISPQLFATIVSSGAISGIREARKPRNVSFITFHLFHIII